MKWRNVDLTLYEEEKDLMLEDRNRSLVSLLCSIQADIHSKQCTREDDKAVHCPLCIRLSIAVQLTHKGAM